MRTVKYDVLVTITAILRKYGGNWCYASRFKMLELLKNYHGIDIGYRQLGNHLADLRNAGLIKSIRRIHRRSDGTICLLTSARCLTMAGCKYLISRGFTWAKNHLQRLKAKYMPPEPGKPNGVKTPQDQEIPGRKNGKKPYQDPDFREKRGLKPLPPFKLKTS